MFMFCKECGKKIPDDSKFCPNCGAPAAALEELSAQEVTVEAIKDHPQSAAADKTTVEKPDSSNPDMPEGALPEQDATWSGNYQKNKMIGLVTYKRIHTEITISTGEIALSQKAGRKNPTETRAALSDLRQITKKSTFDFWDTLYAFIFLGIALICLLCSQLGGAAGAALLGAICFFTGFGKEVSLQFGTGTEMRIHVSSGAAAEDLIGNVARCSRRDLPVTVDKKSTRIVCGGFGALIILGVLLGIIGMLAGGDTTVDQAIDTVRGGYLGGYTDVTVEEIVTDFFSASGEVTQDTILWNGGQTDQGETIVEAQCTYGNGQMSRIQFKMLTEDTFAFNGLEDPALAAESIPIEMCMEILNTIYFTYYMDKYDMEEATDRLNAVSCGAVLCGAGADYQGDRENLYQEAFVLEPISETAAAYLGLLEEEVPVYDTGAYFNILGGYSIALLDGYSVPMLEENGFNTLCAYYDESQVGYVIEDIDGNGVPELLIGEIGEWGGGSGFFFDLYTQVDGQPVLVAASSERDRYYLCQNGMIANEGSSGADDSFCGYYEIDPATGELRIIETVLYQGFYQDAGPWFYTTLQPWEASVYDGSQAEISEAEATEIMERYSYAYIDFQPLPMG